MGGAEHEICVRHRYRHECGENGHHRVAGRASQRDRQKLPRAQAVLFRREGRRVAFGGPANIKIYYTIFLVFHITLATVGAVFGIISLATGYKNNLPIHRKLGPVTSFIWFFTAITGVAVYLLLYVFYKGGQTTSMIKAILGL